MSKPSLRTNDDTGVSTMLIIWKSIHRIQQTTIHKPVRALRLQRAGNQFPGNGSIAADTLSSKAIKGNISRPMPTDKQTTDKPPFLHDDRKNCCRNIPKEDRGVSKHVENSAK
jgi:hypothetical protein